MGLDPGPELTQDVTEHVPGEGPLRLHEAHVAVADEDPVRGVDVLTRRQGPRRHGAHRLGGTRHLGDESVEQLVGAVAQQLVVDVGPPAGQRLRRGSGTDPVVPLREGPVRVGIPVELEMVVGLDLLVERLEHAGERFRPFDCVQQKGRDDGEGHLGDDPQRPEAEAGRLEEVRLPVGSAVDDGPVGEDDTQAPDPGGQPREAQAGAVRPRAERAGDRLAVDVAEVGQGEAELGELVIEDAQRSACADGGLAPGCVDRRDSGESTEPQLNAVGDGHAGERVAGADRLDAQTSVGGADHFLRHLLLRARGRDPAQQGRLGPGPVGPLDAADDLLLGVSQSSALPHGRSRRGRRPRRRRRAPGG